MENENNPNPTSSNSNKVVGWIGRALIILASINYYVIKEAKFDNNKFIDDDSFTFIGFILTFGYLLTILINSMAVNGFKFLRMDKGHFSISVALLCISAYTLNLEFNVFEQFSSWCEIMLFIILIPLLTNNFYNAFPFAIKWLYGFVVGFGIILALYFTIYLIPSWPLGLLAIILLGLGLHFFAPVILLTTLIVQYRKLKPSKKELTGLLAGVITPILIVVYLSINWGVAVNKIQAASNNIPKENKDFPTWYYLSQQLDADPFVNMVLQGNMAYSTPKNTRAFSIMSGSGGTSAYADRFRHDPLIFTTALLGGEIDISTASRLKLLEINYSARHNTEEKLWTGRDLETVKIVNNVELFPEYRIAYNEKTITIHNSREKGWRDDQEALYSFHLPEGTAVTSLSLWVDGVERKSRLTTKQKATGAYNNIVGVQRRDPSIAHWQEGNRITVKVFPCAPEKDRVFKVGFTSPLLKIENTLYYSDIYLQGPILSKAEVTSNIQINGEVENLNIPFSFNEFNQNNFQYSGPYQDDLVISMEAPKLSPNSFCFNGSCYALSEVQKIKKFKKYENIYLDINNAWNEDEINDAIKLFDGKNIMVYHGGMKQVKEVSNETIQLLKSFAFNHIPLNHVDSENSLIITKNSGISPNVIDLRNTQFGKEMKAFSASSEFVPDVFSLNYLNDYWSTQSQLHLANVAYGNFKDLSEMVANSRFDGKLKSDSVVYIDHSKMMITKTDSNLTGSNKAPDHLLRLFGYNHILKKIGRKYYNKEQYEDELLHIANEAFVLSPISSMIVLETDKDYDDHGIKKNKNSLSNANIKSGSVPEPHEWVLIFLAGLILITVYVKRNKTINQA